MSVSVSFSGGYKDCHLLFTPVLCHKCYLCEHPMKALGSSGLCLEDNPSDAGPTPVMSSARPPLEAVGTLPAEPTALPLVPRLTRARGRSVSQDENPFGFSGSRGFTI